AEFALVKTKNPRISGNPRKMDIKNVKLFSKTGVFAINFRVKSSNSYQI
ncbi:unnamed protein product, partial [marine sediment metagenome]